MDRYYTDTRQILFGSKEKLTNVVEAMNTIVSAINDETAYYDHWIWIVPDAATREDFEDIALDKHMLDDTIDEFKMIINAYFK